MRFLFAGAAFLLALAGRGGGSVPSGAVVLVDDGEATVEAAAGDAVGDMGYNKDDVFEPTKEWKEVSMNTHWSACLHFLVQSTCYS